MAVTIGYLTRMSTLLTVELVPSPLWELNLRSLIPAEQWGQFRHAAYQAAGYRCQICDGIGPAHPVECHELWEYDDERGVQKLVGLIALCPACHEVKHAGLAKIRGRSDKVLARLMAINDWSAQQARDHLAQAFATHSRRSKEVWTQDLSWLDDK